MPHPVARRAAEALAIIRQHWGDLLLTIDSPPADVWPPRQLAHTMQPDDEQFDVVDHSPLVLRPHPAPLNVAALDDALAIEQGLFALCDTLAAAVQRAPVGDPRRWQFPTEHTPGSRVHGVHWAAVWVEGRLLDADIEPEQQLDGELLAAPFLPLPEYLLREAADVAHRAAGRVLRALGLDHRTTPVPDRACPWCTGELTVHTGPDEPPTVTCSTGPSCTAPVPLNDRGRRRWSWPELPTLVAALDAAQQRVIEGGLLARGVGEPHAAPRSSGNPRATTPCPEPRPSLLETDVWSHVPHSGAYTVWEIKQLTFYAREMAPRIYRSLAR